VEAFDVTIAEKTYTLHLFEYVIDQAGSEASGGGSSHYQSPSVRGKVVNDADGAPLRGATVELRSGAAQPTGTLVAEVRSAADGTYVFSGLSAGSYTAVASRSGCTDVWRTVTVLTGQTTTGQDLRLVPWESQGITGRLVTTAGGMQISGAVSLFRRVTRDDETFWRYEDTDYMNTSYPFDFYGLDAGTYKLYGTGYDHVPSSLVVTVTSGHVTTQDVALIPWAAQGVSGAVVDDYTSAPIAGAEVRLHEGHDAPAAPLYRRGTTSAAGTFVYTGSTYEVEAGEYTLTVEKDGYLLAFKNVTVAAGAISDAGTIRLREPGGNSMNAPDNAATIRWTRGVDAANATYEFWFRPLAWGYMEYGSVIAAITRDYPDWLGQGPHRLPSMQVRYGGSSSDVVFEYWMNENDGSAYGSSHVVTGTTAVELGHWYHVAVQHGTWGMLLYVNGVLEAWDSDYHGAPEANAGAAIGGWFSLGGNEAFPGYQTAMGDFRGLRVSDAQRYSVDFTPPYTPDYDWSTTIYDELLGTTEGENLGFVVTP